MSEPIRFDRESGRLVGTNLPAIPELIEGMKAMGLRAIKGATWLPTLWNPDAPKCGCLLGISAAIRAEGDPRGPFSVLMANDAGRLLGLNHDATWAIAGGFDGTATHHLGDDGEQAANYAYEAGMAITAAGLWHRATP